MIKLIAPVNKNLNTGGYLVNARLSADDRIESCFAAPADLLACLADTTATWVVDSLYLVDCEHARTISRAVGETPAILMAHSLPSFFAEDEGRQRRAELREHEVLSRFRGVVAPSSFMSGELCRRGVDKDRIRVVPPAPIVDGRGKDLHMGNTTRPANSEAGPIKILTVANWSRVKGIADAVRALAHLAAGDWHWTIVGAQSAEDPYVRKVHELIESSGIGSRITILPSKEPRQLSRLYRKSDLFVLPSHMESYGLAFTEAISFGLPVVGYRSGAVPEVVAGAGILVPIGDWRALASEIAQLLADQTLRETARRRAREVAGGLPEWPAVRDQFVSVVESLALNGAAA